MQIAALTLFWYISNPVMLEFGSGRALFYGMLVSLLACALSLRFSKPWAKVILRATAILGAALVILSATPMPVWLYAAWLATLATALLLIHHQTRTRARALAGLGLLTLGSLIIAAVELPFHVPPRVPRTEASTVYVVGDSISAGIGQETKTWPQMMDERFPCDVVDLAVGGATAESALDQAAKIKDGRSIVLLQIGGNDTLFSRVGAQQFEIDLRRLLSAIRRPDRTLVMLELPLRPLTGAYGDVQRNLSQEFGVTLIPKRFMVRLIGTEGATVDGLHFSDFGHLMMAEMMWEFLN